MARARRQKRRRQQWLAALSAVVVVVVVGGLIWLNNQPLPLTAVEMESPVDADGAAWGPADAPVVIEEWSDFQ